MGGRDGEEGEDVCEERINAVREEVSAQSAAVFYIIYCGICFPCTRWLVFEQRQLCLIGRSGLRERERGRRKEEVRTR